MSVFFSFLKNRRSTALRKYFKQGVYTEQQCHQRLQNFTVLMGSCLSVVIIVTMAFLFALIIGDYRLWIEFLEMDSLSVLLLWYVTRRMSQWILLPHEGMTSLYTFAEPYPDILYYLRRVSTMRPALTYREFDLFARALRQRMWAKRKYAGHDKADYSVDMLA